ncbi:B12-binding domain-containing radical SAM protein [Candidatus Saganbacteria bacterium]|nr:B12-binding domain-containing radical SAM protein [Candidatus Saganbacteria bacterium]
MNSSLKATLVYPGIGMRGFNSYGRGSDPVVNYINHGLCSISSYAKQKGYDVKGIDLRKLRDWEHYSEILKEQGSEVVGFSIMSIDLLPALEAIKITKQTNPKAITVVGGVHPTIMLEQMKSNNDIDIIVVGEGEVIFSRILDIIKSGGMPDRVYQGEATSLDTLSWIDRDLFDVSAELFHPFIKSLKAPFVTLNVGRGCPFNCTFCQPAERRVFGDRVRMRSVENVIDELDHLYSRYKFNSFMVHDDLFTYDKKWVMRFCEEYNRLGIKKKFVCQSRADIISNNEELIYEMKKSGLACLIIGFESGSQRILDFIKKGTTVEQNLRAAEICRKNGVEIFANYMFGLPTETKEEVEQTISIIEKIDPDYDSPSYFTPHPGSELFLYCKEHGLSLIKDHEVDRSPRSQKIKGVDYLYLDSRIRSIKKKRLLKKIANKFRETIAHWRYIWRRNQ